MTWPITSYLRYKNDVKNKWLCISAWMTSQSKTVLRLSFQICRKKIVDIGQKCIRYGAVKIYISGLIHRASVSLVLLGEIKRKLWSICLKTNGFYFVDNDYIGRNYFCKEDLHLLRYGKKPLAGNFIIILKDDYFFSNNTHHLPVLLSMSLV